MTGYIDFQDNKFSTMRCHHRHPPLSILNGTLLGGNCKDHAHHENVDLFVALDDYQKAPLFTTKDDLAYCVNYPITNMKAPNRIDKFQRLVSTIVDFLDEGKTVHVGCIGGHGRTGLVIAAVVARLGIAGDDNDAIGWVRENYCKKAVESQEQVGFLVTHFKVKPLLIEAKVDKRFAGF